MHNDHAEAIRQRIYTYISDFTDARQSIKLVYLFGSALNPEQLNAGSDIDLAFLIDPPLYKKDPLLYSTPAYMSATEIGLLLDRQTDVIILNAASIETAYQVVTTGLLLYKTDCESNLEYEAAARGLYYDFKPFLQQLRKQRMLRPRSEK